MRKLTVLRTCVDFVFFFGTLSMVFLILFCGLIVFGGEPIILQLNGYDIEVNDWATRLLVILAVAAAGLFLYAIYMLRETIGLFRRRIIFDDRVARNFDRIGWCIMVSTCISHIPLFVYNIIHRTRSNFQLEAGLSMDSFLISVSLGLLFMVISQAFVAGKQLKEENDLTI